VLDVDHNEGRGLPARAARAACAGLAPPKLVLGLLPAREWAGLATGRAMSKAARMRDRRQREPMFAGDWPANRIVRRTPRRAILLGMVRRPRGIALALGVAAVIVVLATLRYATARFSTRLGSWLYTTQPSKASVFLQVGCAFGDAEACHWRAHLFQDGRGAPQDLGRAMELYEVACDDDFGDACNDGAWLLSKIPAWHDPKRIFSLYQRACELGSTWAARTSPASTTAAKWYRKTWPEPSKCWTRPARGEIREPARISASTTSAGTACRRTMCARGVFTRKLVHSKTPSVAPISRTSWTTVAAARRMRRKRCDLIASHAPELRDMPARTSVPC
jgi:hypothetical protein